MTKKDLFLDGLKELMEKYGACISFSCSPCSDTHGLSEDGIIIEVEGEIVYREFEWHIDTKEL